LLLGERIYAIDKVPSFYDYLGYLYYCGGTIAGPFYEYKDYIDFMNREGHYSKIPSTIVATLERLAVAICIFILKLIFFSFHWSCRSHF